MDFGIAKIGKRPSKLTEETTVGTLEYISPEQAQNAQDLNHRADIYSLGVLAYQMMTGQLPIQGKNVAELIFSHIMDTPLSPDTLNPNIPPHVSNAIMRALEKNPKNRPASAGEFMEMMTHINHPPQITAAAR